MKKESFYQFIFRELAKSPISRMNLPTFTRVIRKKVQDVSTLQLLYVYKQLERLKSNSQQFHFPTHNKFLPQQKNIIKIQSYEKHTLICLEEIAIKLKQKNGFEEGMDLCKLFYLRLLNAIEYHLPYVNTLELFREEFLWKDVGEEVIDYVGLIQKDPTGMSQLYIETVNFIIQTVGEELQNIDVLQLPYLKSILSKAESYDVFQIDAEMIERLDSMICHNKFVYSFKQLQNCLKSDKKNMQTFEYFSLITKDPIEKRLYYLYIDSMNQGVTQFNNLNNDTEFGLPGRSVFEENLDLVMRIMSQMSLYGVYMDIFPKIHKQKEISKASTLKQYIKYHFNYFYKSGNVHCNKQKITEVLYNTIGSDQIMQKKGIKYIHLDILKCFFVLQMLSRSQINHRQLLQSHHQLNQQLQILNSINKIKFQTIHKVFQNSINHYNNQLANLNQIKQTLTCFNIFINSASQKHLTDLISQQLETFSPLEKTFIMNELIICLLNNCLENSPVNMQQSLSKLLQILMKIQFKKFSVESANIHKILSIVHQKKQLSQQQLKSILLELNLSSKERSSQFKKDLTDRIANQKYQEDTNSIANMSCH